MPLIFQDSIILQSSLMNDSSSGTTTAKEIYQNKSTLSTTSGTCTLALLETTSIYYSTPDGDITYAFDTTNLTNTGKVITFELIIDMSLSVYTVVFPTVTWQDNTTPDLSTSNLYMLTFRSFDNGSTWMGSLQGKW